MVFVSGWSCSELAYRIIIVSILMHSDGYCNISITTRISRWKDHWLDIRQRHRLVDLKPDCDHECKVSRLIKDTESDWVTPMHPPQLSSTQPGSYMLPSMSPSGSGVCLRHCHWPPPSLRVNCAKRSRIYLNPGDLRGKKYSN